MTGTGTGRAAAAIGAGVAAVVVLAACTDSPATRPATPASSAAGSSATSVVPAVPASPGEPPSSAGSPAPGGQPGTVPPAQPTALPPLGLQGTPVPASQWSGRGAPGAAPSAVSTSDGGRVVHVVVQHPSCGRVTATVQEQTSSTVRIALDVYVLRTLRACPADVGQYAVTARLAAPLGQRRIVFVGTRR